VNTEFLNRDIVQASYRWSKGIFEGYEGAEINDWLKPVLVQAYVSGR
jgi:hypothetical protein